MVRIIIISIVIIISSFACKKRVPGSSNIKTNQQLEMSYPFSFVTDLEGNIKGLLNNLKEKGLKLENGRLHFTHNQAELFIGGDLSDRGSDSIKIRRLIGDLKKRHPDRVHIIWGNRDINKLGFHGLLPSLDGFLHEEYKEWLSKGETRLSHTELEKRNTPENKLEWFFNEIGCNQCLEFHQKELSELKGRPISIREAAEDYIQSLHPKEGEFFKFLEMGQFIATKGRTIMTHGQITKENFGFVPDSSTRYENMAEWLEALNRWGKSKLSSIKSTYHPDILRGQHSRPTTELIQYCDSKWDQSFKKGYGNEVSVVYAPRNKEGNNFRLPDKETLQLLTKQGYSTLIVGHSPAGNTPLPLKGEGFIQIMADTSYGGNRSSQVSFDYLGQVKLQGNSQSGHTIKAEISPHIDSPIGKNYKEATVVGRINDTTLLTFRYNKDYSIAESTIPEGQLIEGELKTPHYKYNHSSLSQRADLIEALSRQNVPMLTLSELLEGPLKGKQALYLATDPKVGGDIIVMTSLLNEFEQTLKKLNPKDFVFINNGQTNAMESVLFATAKQRGFQVIGALSESVTPIEVNYEVIATTIIAESAHTFNRNLFNFLKQIGAGTIFFGEEKADFKEQLELVKKLELNSWSLNRPGAKGNHSSGHSLAEAITSQKSATSQRTTQAASIHQGLKIEAIDAQVTSKVSTLQQANVLSKAKMRQELAKRSKKLAQITLGSYLLKGNPASVMAEVEPILNRLSPVTHVVSFSIDLPKNRLENSLNSDQKENIKKVYEMARSKGFQTALVGPQASPLRSIPLPTMNYDFVIGFDQTRTNQLFSERVKYQAPPCDQLFQSFTTAHPF